jgi:hypothetical protein
MALAQFVEKARPTKVKMRVARRVIDFIVTVDVGGLSRKVKKVLIVLDGFRERNGRLEKMQSEFLRGVFFERSRIV